MGAGQASIMASRDPDFDNDGTAGDGYVTWQHALEYINLLNSENFLGYDDWRLPTIKELVTIVDAGRYNPVTNTVFTNTAEYMYGRTYWSSSDHEHLTDRARCVDFRTGVMIYLTHSSTASAFVWCGDASYDPLSDLVVNGDGTITDATTGLMWQQCTYGPKHGTARNAQAAEIANHGAMRFQA